VVPVENEEHLKLLPQVDVLVKIAAGGEIFNVQGGEGQGGEEGDVDDDLVCLLSTSGSSGLPKFAKFTEKLVLPQPEGFVRTSPFVRADLVKFDPSFIPSLMQTLQFGGSRYFVRVENLVDDLGRVRPTHLGAPPSVWSFLSKIDGLKQKVGSRLVVCTSGGAPILDMVKKDLEKKLGVKVVNLYGCREAGGIARDGKVYSGITVLVQEGEPFKQNGVGTVFVNSPKLISSYSAESKSAFITLDDGLIYYNTGDVGRLVTENNEQQLDIFDRQKSMIKDDDGVWLYPSKLELLVETCELVVESFIFYDAGTCFCVAVTEDCNVSDEEVIAGILLKCRNLRVKPTKYHIRRAKFDNDLMTSTLKKKRNALLSLFLPQKEKFVSALVSDSSVKYDPRVQEAVEFASNERSLQEMSSVQLAAVKFYLKKNFDVSVSIEELLSGQVNQIISSNASVGVVEFDWNDEVEYLWAQLSSSSSSLAVSRPKSSSSADAALLIGSGGFLGKELQRSLSGVFSKVVCLSRSLGNFELSKEFSYESNFLFSDVFINAAQISLTLPYSKLRGTNVLGLVAIIQWCLQRPKMPKIHFVSSGIFFCSQQLFSRNLK
jgi:hypothetical protein